MKKLSVCNNYVIFGGVVGGARRRCTNLHVQECSVVDAGIVR